MFFCTGKLKDEMVGSPDVRPLDLAICINIQAL
jgi:hypothetical protein